MLSTLFKILMCYKVYSQIGIWDLIIRKTVIISLSEDMKKLDKAISRGVDDDNVIASALFGKVDSIVTDDKDLSMIEDYKNYKKIKILSQGDFWELKTP